MVLYRCEPAVSVNILIIETPIILSLLLLVSKISFAERKKPCYKITFAFDLNAFAFDSKFKCICI